MLWGTRQASLELPGPQDGGFSREMREGLKDAGRFRQKRGMGTSRLREFNSDLDL